MDYKEILEDFCNELIQIQDDEWKPVQIFRSNSQVETDEIRHEFATEIADRAREILQEIAENGGSEESAVEHGQANDCAEKKCIIYLSCTNPTSKQCYKPPAG